MDCTHKFRDILRSGKALAELSDQICTEHNLSVITEPKSKDQSYDPELITKGEITARDTLRMSIDAALRMRPDGFDALMQLLEDAGLSEEHRSASSRQGGNALSGWIQLELNTQKKYYA